MRRIVILIAGLLLTSCVSGHCRKPTAQPVIPSDEKAEASDAHIFVYKPDGSRQCHQGKAISLNEMKKQLNGITVFSQSKKKDGLMHIAMCGSPTGLNNVYEISAKDLPAAEKLNFRKWLY